MCCLALLVIGAAAGGSAVVLSAGSAVVAVECSGWQRGIACRRQQGPPWLRYVQVLEVSDCGFGRLLLDVAGTLVVIWKLGKEACIAGLGGWPCGEERDGMLQAKAYCRPCRQQ